METIHGQLLKDYKQALSGELQHILDYWSRYSPDHLHGGFVGRVSNDNQVDPLADKGSVLNARILWAFSAAFNSRASNSLELADRAYHYLVTHFIDIDYGGVYWTVDYKGNPKETKKQIYAVAFSIYALSEYFIASGNELAKEHAVALFHDLVNYSHDEQHGGYDEAFTRAWEPIADLRLSDKDANEKKSMNTNLHVLEAFTNLYRIWPDEDLKKLISELINNFKDHIIDAQNHHLILFFDEAWTRKSDAISYGHDIEASWLLLDAAEVIEDPVLVEEAKVQAVKLAEAALSGLNADGSLNEKHWWVQAEAMVGFYNAWQLTGEERYLKASVNNWHFVKSHIVDQQHGEWFWGIDDQDQVMSGEDKIGLWKCPYHNSRACIELIGRIN